MHTSPTHCCWAPFEWAARRNQALPTRSALTVSSSNGRYSYAWAFQAPSDVTEIVIHNPEVEEDPACGPLIDEVGIRTLYPPRLTNKNILKNGGFEECPYIFPNTCWGVLPPNIEDDHSPLPGWMVESLKAV
ncbi:hypothetical protein SLEP1_g49522 [Rubroshorea leprosula]|uniref:DUF642 domain-containing protein n=1 Tax=Rubroshorea leprosula TaxID=152421 RepID=A0AAV5LXW6_9ROSI|nr:hypothetical protein SLEP1_g49522 [Rubroshorea leprosula]